VEALGLDENVFGLLTAGFRALRSPVNPRPDKVIIFTLARLYWITTEAVIELQ
jgi:hypothetical protein